VIYRDLTPPLNTNGSDYNEELWEQIANEVDIARVEKVAAGISDLLSLLPPADRAEAVKAVLRGMEGVTNGR
jgi:DNA mismatch repair protein MutH